MIKNYSILMLFLIIGSSISAQDFSELKNIDLSSPEKCRDAQTKVIESCNYLLSTSCEENLKGLNAHVFIIEWMIATSDFNFSLDDKLYKVIISDEILTSRYYAALAKIAIEEKLKGDELQLKGMTLFLEYCENPSNKVKIKKKLKKYINAKNSNTLSTLIASK